MVDFRNEWSPRPLLPRQARFKGTGPCDVTHRDSSGVFISWSSRAEIFSISPQLEPDLEARGKKLWNGWQESGHTITCPLHHQPSTCQCSLRPKMSRSNQRLLDIISPKFLAGSLPLSSTPTTSSYNIGRPRPLKKGRSGVRNVKLLLRAVFLSLVRFW
jgi:hypothetical protein